MASMVVINKRLIFLLIISTIVVGASEAAMILYKEHRVQEIPGDGWVLAPVGNAAACRSHSEVEQFTEKVPMYFAHISKIAT